MSILISGLLLWSAVHLLPSLGRGLRARMITTLGEIPYKAAFSLLIVASVVLMVLGWRAAEPASVYVPPAWGRLAALGLMPVAMMLFFAARTPTNLKRLLRHPQLTGVALWSIAHLLANGDSRALILFGGIGVWALVEMMAVNRRDGAWVRPAPLPAKGDALTVGVGLAVFAILLFAHPYLSGVRLIGA